MAYPEDNVKALVEAALKKDDDAIVAATLAIGVAVLSDLRRIADALESQSKMYGECVDAYKNAITPPFAKKR